MFYCEKIIFINKLKVVGSDTCRYIHKFFHFFFPKENEKEGIFEVLAIILHLGNVDFGKTEVLFPLN